MYDNIFQLPVSVMVNIVKLKMLYVSYSV